MKEHLKDEYLFTWGMVGEWLSRQRESYIQWCEKLKQHNPICEFKSNWG